MITYKKITFLILFFLGVLILIFLKIEFFNDKNEYLVEQTFEEDENYPMIVNSGSGIIFIKKEGFLPKKTRIWKAQEEDVQKAEKILLECKEKGLLEILPKLSEYNKRQYIGYYDEKMNKLILVRGIRDPKNKLSEWEKGTIVTVIGGSNFFSATLDLDNKKCVYFTFSNY